MRELVEMVCVVTIATMVFLVCVMAPIIGGAIAVEQWQCGKYEQATGKATKYTGAECYVQDDGKWYAWAEYKNRLVTAGSMK